MSPSLRKAAILINTLDARSADALLDQMGEVQARRVRDAAMELAEMDPDEQQDVLAEFMGRTTTDDDDGVELSGSLAESFTQEATAVTEKPFAFLHDAPAAVVAMHLRRELPQTMAMVIAHLPPPQAAAVVAELSPAVQADVLSRIGDFSDIDREVVRAVEAGLQRLIGPELENIRRRGAGRATVQAILQAADETGAKVLHARVSIPARQPVVETKPQEPLPRQHSSSDLSFAELIKLDDRGWARVLRSTQPQIALMALAGAEPSLVTKLLRRMSDADARSLQRKMETLGPIRLRDIETAQRLLAEVASDLMASGEIELPRPSRFAAAA